MCQNLNTPTHTHTQTHKFYTWDSTSLDRPKAQSAHACLLVIHLCSISSATGESTCPSIFSRVTLYKNVYHLLIGDFWVFNVITPVISTCPYSGNGRTGMMLNNPGLNSLGSSDVLSRSCHLSFLCIVQIYFLSCPQTNQICLVGNVLSFDSHFDLNINTGNVASRLCVCLIDTDCLRIAPHS